LQYEADQQRRRTTRQRPSPLSPEQEAAQVSSHTTTSQGTDTKQTDAGARAGSRQAIVSSSSDEDSDTWATQTPTFNIRFCPPSRQP
jgi:hypothetical protein